MTRKLTYEFVKAGFEKRGYTLVDAVYVNVETKMKCLCSKNHECFISWHSFNGGSGCHECGSRKTSMEEIRELFDSKGLELLSDEYESITTKLDYRCKKCGKEKSALLSNVKKKRKKWCLDCYSKTKRPSEYEVRKVLSDVGFEFLGIDVSGRTTVNIRCDFGHEREVEWSYFIHNGKRCPECNLSKLYTLEEIKDIVAKEGFELLSDEYLGNKEEIYLRCPEGHKYKTRFNYFQQGNRCSVCNKQEMRARAKARRISTDYIRERFAEEGFTILSMEYTDAHSDIVYECDKGHINTTCWNAFRDRPWCPRCSKGSSHSKMSQVWLDGLGVPVENREFWFTDLQIRADAYDEATNTVYEFLGDYWHGNPNVYDMDEIFRDDVTYGQLFDKTMARLFLLIRNGYNLVIIWEEDFLKQQQQEQ